MALARPVYKDDRQDVPFLLYKPTCQALVLGIYNKIQTKPLCVYTKAVCSGEATRRL